MPYLIPHGNALGAKLEEERGEIELQQFLQLLFRIGESYSVRWNGWSACGHDLCRVTFPHRISTLPTNASSRASGDCVDAMLSAGGCVWLIPEQTGDFEVGERNARHRQRRWRGGALLPLRRTLQMRQLLLRNGAS
jgi:hypothetical protein